MFNFPKLDIAVIGAGHAGIEAGLASAKLGLSTAVFTMNLDSVGNCPCNPSIGGTAKGHLVKEIDALGGTMGKIADACCIQSRVLNRGKGAAVQSLRMQIDRSKYKNLMKHTLEKQKNLFLKQAEIVSLELLTKQKDNIQNLTLNYCTSNGSLQNLAEKSLPKLPKNLIGLHDNNSATDEVSSASNQATPNTLIGNDEYTINSPQHNDDLSEQIEEISKQNNGYVWVLTTRLGSKYLAKSVIITTGTYLNSRIFIGNVNYSSGPDGLFPANYLSCSFKKLGVKLLRFKTGTPARVLKSSIDFNNLQVQKGDPNLEIFSNYNETPCKPKNKLDCHITWTNQKTKEIILKNIHKSPVYSGDIHGTGPRYCPSIEDKIVRFKDKERHQLFIEPCGEDTEEMYLQGMSSGLPEDVQMEFYKSIKGLENVSIMRPAYAIEYDCADPIQLTETLEFKNIPYLFGAGQFNGSSGYEEAAAQGLVAGINAALKILGKEKLVLRRSNSYIGTLIDDLVTKGVKEPYRMMTARSEYRLLLRQDNAYERLSKIGKEVGLLSEKIYLEIQNDINIKYKEIKRLKNTVIAPSKKVNDFLNSLKTSEISTGITLYELLKRPQLTYENLCFLDENASILKKHIKASVEAEIKYEGYVSKQEKEIKDLQRLEEQKLPNGIDYLQIHGLRLEAREKLNKFRPSNVGMASRIAGVNPADITALLVWLMKHNSTRQK